MWRQSTSWELIRGAHRDLAFIIMKSDMRNEINRESDRHKCSGHRDRVQINVPIAQWPKDTQIYRQDRYRRCEDGCNAWSEDHQYNCHTQKGEDNCWFRYWKNCKQLQMNPMLRRMMWNFFSGRYGNLHLLLPIPFLKIWISSVA